MHIRSFLQSFFPAVDPIKSALPNLSPDLDDTALENELTAYIDKVATLSSAKDSKGYLEKAAALIPLDRLQHIAGIHAEQSAQDMCKVAKYYLKTTERSLSVRLRSAVNSFIDAVSSAVESIINAFGIHRFFKPSRNENENNFRSNIITGLVSIVTLFTTILLPILGATLAAPIVGGLFILISLTGLVYPYIKPMPHHVIDGDNWTRKAESHNLPRGLTNKVVLENLAQALAANKKVIITGPSRVGKTQSIKDLTYALAEGSKQVTSCLPEIAQVFSWNSANLITAKNGDGVSVIQKIRDAFGRHITRVITVFDEFGKTCTDKKNNRLVAQLLTELDDKLDKVVAIATDEEYTVLCQMHPSLKNRFIEFKVQSLASTDTEMALHHTLLQEAPQTLVEGDALGYLVREYERRFGEAHPDTPLPPQPHTCKELLHRCIQRVSKAQKLPISHRLEKIRGDLGGIYPKAGVENKVASQNIREKYAELTQCKNEYDLAKKRFEVVVAKLDDLLVVKKEMHRTVLQINSLAPTSPKYQLALGTYLLQGKLITRLEQTIKQEALAQNVRLVIDKPLIDEILNQEF